MNKKDKIRRSSVSEVKKNISYQRDNIKNLTNEKLLLLEKEIKIKKKLENVEKNLKQLFKNSSDCQSFLSKLKQAVADDNQSSIVFTRNDSFITKNLSR